MGKSVGLFSGALVSLDIILVGRRSLDVSVPLFLIVPLHKPVPGFLSLAYRLCAGKDHQPTEEKLKHNVKKNRMLGYDGKMSQDRLSNHY